MISSAFRFSFWLPAAVGALAVVGGSPSALATNDCNNLPNHAELKLALGMANDSVDLTLNNEMWGTLVSADGTVCAIAFTGDDNLQSQWLASRVISAQKRQYSQLAQPRQ